MGVKLSEWRLKITENIEKTMIKLNGASDKAAAKFTKLQDKINGFRGGLKDAAGQVPVLNSVIEAVSNPYLAIATAVVAVGIGIGIAINKAGEFKQKTAELSAITGIAGKELAYLEEQGKRVGISSGLGANQAVEAYKLLASNIDIATVGGVKGLKLLGDETILLAQAGQVDLPTAADTMAGAINQFSLEANQASRVVNVLAAGAKFGAAEIPQLAASLKIVGTSAGIAGVSIENTVGALEVLSQSGIKGGEAGTGLRNVMLKLQTELGKDISGKGFNKALTELKPKLSDTTFLAKIFGAENIGVAQSLIKNAQAVEEMTEKVTGTQTALEQASIQTNTYKGALDRMKAGVDVLFIDFGETLLSPLTTLFNLATDGILWLRENIQAVKAVLIGAAVGVAVYGGAWMVTNGFIALATTTLIPAVIAGIKAVGVAIISIPIIGWIAGIISALVIAYQTSDKFRAVINGIGAVLASFVPFLMAIGNVFLNAFNPVKAAKAAAAAVEEFKKIDVSKAFNDAYDKTISEAAKKQESALGAAGVGSSDPAKNQGVGADKNKKAQDGLQAVNEGGKQVRNITVHFDNLVKEFTINAQTVKEGASQMRDVILEEIIRAVAGAEQII